VRSLLLSEVFPPHVGGSGRWFWEIYRRLPTAEYCIAAGEHSQQGEFDARQTCDITRFPLTMRQWGVRSWEGLRGYGRAIRLLRKLVRTRRVSMVHCGRCLPEGVMALALKWSLRVPYLCYVHGEDIGAALNSREHALLVRRALSGAVCCIANSKNTAQLLAQKWNLVPPKVQVLNPGVDTKFFVPAQREHEIRRRLGWDNRSVVLTVGRLQQRKGHDMLIRALPAILARIPNVLYAIVGEGREQESLGQLARQCGVLPHVQFLGNLCDAELRHCYQQCDLFALPNREIDGDIEGFGMVLVEAQSCGKPVVAGRSGGTSETMCEGTTGELVACESPAPLAKTLARLLLDEQRREEMGRHARRWVVEQFDWEKLASRARDLFKSLSVERNGRKRGLACAARTDV
jgi:phosphatidyl-myo-inositol dimannoside synthase